MKPLSDEQISFIHSNTKAAAASWADAAIAGKKMAQLNGKEVLTVSLHDKVFSVLRSSPPPETAVLLGVDFDVLRDGFPGLAEHVEEIAPRVTLLTAAFTHHALNVPEVLQSVINQPVEAINKVLAKPHRTLSDHYPLLIAASRAVNDIRSRLVDFSGEGVHESKVKITVPDWYLKSTDGTSLQRTVSNLLAPSAKQLTVALPDDDLEKRRDHLK